MVEAIDLIEVEEIQIDLNRYMYICYFWDEIGLNISLKIFEKKILIFNIENGTIELDYDEKKTIFKELLEKLRDFNKNMIQVSDINKISTKILDELQEEKIISSYNDFGDMNIYIFF